MAQSVTTMQNRPITKLMLTFDEIQNLRLKTFDKNDFNKYSNSNNIFVNTKYVTLEKKKTRSFLIRLIINNNFSHHCTLTDVIISSIGIFFEHFRL